MCVIKSNPYETAREWHQAVDTGVRLPSRILEATFHTCQIELSMSGFMSHLKLEPQVQFLSQRRCSLDLVKWNWSYFPPLRLWSQWNKLQSKNPKIRSWLLRNVEWNMEANTNHPLFLGPFCDPLSSLSTRCKASEHPFPFWPGTILWNIFERKAEILSRVLEWLKNLNHSWIHLLLPGQSWLKDHRQSRID